MQDSVTIRNLWLESVLQKWAAKFFAKASDSDYRRSLAWSWQTDYSQETKNLIFKAHESAAAMQKAAIAFGIKQKNPNRILKCVDLLADGPPGRPPLRSPEVVVPHGPPREDIHNQLPALHNLLDPSSLEPGTSATGVLELQALALQAKEDQHAKRDAIRLDRIATVERVTELVLHAPSLKAKFHHAKLLMRRKGSPCLGSTSYDEPEVELERLIEHLQEPPRSVSLESPPTVLAELHREHAAQETHAVPQGVPLLAPTQDPAVAHISSDAVARALKQEKPLKSCLRGTAPTALLKLAGASLIPFLTSLFKLACLLHFLPDTACDATTILLPKAGARGQFSFRLICLLHRIWTVYTGTIANALRTVAITPDTLAYDLLATAFGFLPGCGTRHVLLMVRAVIHTIMQRKLAVTLLFLDLAKAFDSLDRSGFPAALAALQIAMGWTCMIETVHQHTLYTITAFGHRFRCRTLRGVRQGSREGPIIFLLVFALALRELGWVISATHDTLYAIYICEDGTIRRFNLLHITFADDTTLVLPTTNVAELGEIVAKLWSILRRYGLSLNWKKTVYMIVGGPTADHPDPGSPLTLPAQDGFPGAQITRVRTVTLVGQRVSVVTGGFQGPQGVVPVTAEIGRRIQLASAAAIAVGHRFWRNTNLPTVVKLRFLDAFVLSILLYCLETLPTLPESCLDKLERFQTRMLRKILMPAGEKVYRIEREKLRCQAGASSIRSLIRERRLALFWDWALGPLDERVKSQGAPECWPAAAEFITGKKLCGFKPALMAALEPDGPFLTSCLQDLEYLKASLLAQGICPSPPPATLEDWKAFAGTVPRKDWNKLIRLLRTPVDEHVLWKGEQDLPYVCDYCLQGFARAVDKASHIRLAHLDQVEGTVEYRVRTALNAMLKQYPYVGCPACGRPFTPPNKDTKLLTKEQHNVFMHHLFIFNKAANATHAPCGTVLLQYFENPQQRGDLVEGPRHPNTVSPLRPLSIRGLAFFKTATAKRRYFTDPERAHNFKETAALSLKFLTYFWYGLRVGDIRSFLKVVRDDTVEGGGGGGIGLSERVDIDLISTPDEGINLVSTPDDIVPDIELTSAISPQKSIATRDPLRIGPSSLDLSDAVSQEDEGTHPARVQPTGDDDPPRSRHGRETQAGVPSSPGRRREPVRRDVRQQVVPVRSEVALGVHAQRGGMRDLGGTPEPPLPGRAKNEVHKPQVGSRCAGQALDPEHGEPVRRGYAELPRTERRSFRAPAMAQDAGSHSGLDLHLPAGEAAARGHDRNRESRAAIAETQAGNSSQRRRARPHPVLREHHDREEAPPFRLQDLERMERGRPGDCPAAREGAGEEIPPRRAWQVVGRGEALHARGTAPERTRSHLSLQGGPEHHDRAPRSRSRTRRHGEGPRRQRLQQLELASAQLAERTNDSDQHALNHDPCELRGDSRADGSGAESLAREERQDARGPFGGWSPPGALLPLSGSERGRDGALQRTGEATQNGTRGDHPGHDFPPGGGKSHQRDDDEPGHEAADDERTVHVGAGGADLVSARITTNAGQDGGLALVQAGPASGSGRTAPDGYAHDRGLDSRVRQGGSAPAVPGARPGLVRETRLERRGSTKHLGIQKNKINNYFK